MQKYLGGMLQPSFPSALQLRVSFGLLNNLPPFFSILHQSSPSVHFHFAKIVMHILQPSQPGVMIQPVRLFGTIPTAGIQFS
jgi:hypothetical protein